ncbi:nitrous oxidase accessory protein NosD [Streptomyces sp. CG 926]|nr:nitrous oxidase accessory protein NosD [Streptomyces sp. CG 926]
MLRSRWRTLAAVPTLALTASCGLLPAGGAATTDKGHSPSVIRVPADASTITQAVDRARPGDLVLLSPGVYKETVTIRTERIVLRGADRNRVVIDGEGRRGNGVVVTAPATSVENLTVRGHLQNGVLVTGMTSGGEGVGRGSDGYHLLDPKTDPPLNGFRVRYVTAVNNGLYGIYAFNAHHGLIEHNYASGSADSGLYVGQCKPCDIAVRGNLAERNAVGYEGTNASDRMWVTGNRFSGNRVGMTVNSDYLEALVPQTGATIAGNLIADNAAPDTPEQADGGFGIGIGIAGGRANTILRNRVTGHPRAALVLASAEDLPPNGNRAEGNLFQANTLDVAYLASPRAPGSNNCLTGNTLATTLPADLATTMACPGDAAPAAGPTTGLTSPPAPVGTPFLDVPAPPAQPQMPHAATAPAEPATGLPGPIDLASVHLPAPGLLTEWSRDRR